MLRYGYSTAGAAIAVVLGAGLETNLRAGLLLKGGSFWEFITPSMDVQDGLGSGYCPSLETVDCTCRFSEKLIFGLFWIRGVIGDALTC